MSRDTFDIFTPPERGRFGENEAKPRDTRVTGASDMVDLTLQIRQDRPTALMVSDPAKGADAKWIALPKSQIEYEIKGAAVVVTLPEWLASAKGLI